MNAFELRSMPDKKGRKRRLYLLQLPYKTSVLAEVSEPRTIASIDGAALDAASIVIVDLLLPLMEVAGADKDPLATPFSLALEEDMALRIALLFASVQGLRSEERIQQMISRVQVLDAADARFWLDKISSDTDGRMIRSFRCAMTGEI